MPSNADTKISATGKRRLLKLADFLEGLPRDKKFDMSLMTQRGDDGRPACGTAACALGWGTCIPSFRRAGYSLTNSGQLRLSSHPFLFWFDEIASVFFDISKDQALRVFGTNQARVEGAGARRDAVKRIRALVKRAA